MRIIISILYWYYSSSSTSRMLRCEFLNIFYMIYVYIALLWLWSLLRIKKIGMAIHDTNT